LEYTVFRIPHLNDGEADLSVAAGVLGDEYKGTLQLSRKSLARWVWEEVERRNWVSGVPVLGNY